MTLTTKTIHVIGASFAGLAFVDKYKDLNPDSQIILIDKESCPNYIPNGINQLFRGDIQDLSDAMWGRACLAAQIESNHRFIQAEVLAIEAPSNTLLLKDSQGRVFEEGYETLVCAMGASPQSHYIETSQTNKVLLTKYYEESQASLKLIEASQEVLVIGAGLIGLDLAYSLSLQGKRVKLIEAAERPDFYQTDAELIAPVMAEMSTHHVTFINNKRVTAIHEIEGKVVAHTEQGDTFQGDLAILAINFRPNTHLLQGQVACALDKTILVNENLQTSQANIYAIGDMVSLHFGILGMDYYTPLINQAMKTGQALALHLAGYPIPPLQTVKVLGSSHFGYYRASVGVTEEEAELYMDTCSYLYQNGDSKNLFWLKLIARKTDGILIGAQLLSKTNALVIANQLGQALALKVTDADLAFQDFLFLQGHSDLAYHLHEACLKLFEKRLRHED
ncbi:TPA: FAD-dependent oxidoreductase [Streptococcus pyogenes]|uniref:FAD-dependent oxidoreductase n=1 Tax=Streptococcus pyogenes TaxID=1314 RepID=UPI002B0CC950|nr:NAD(P)/FAD-dependent oxidoreductase [Streptococcus pyogenes]HEQ2899171.1 NAD(P)/FAD-dependent oxidoreductase [Streptococcus pyogenes]HER0873395.1 NAD(P)/FAD-dependent oxidoreductase [Streptococcus pyogenes]HER0876666.1 NAD(P)/FAD-dependent oxidoreductase [Streptococcus pyogenes]HER7670896.1 NAD(P)/FAD-dependent oxidoreductase [Streptococcus pyogenes]